MAKFKFDDVTAEQEAQEEATRTNKPVRVKGVGTADTPRLDPEPDEESPTQKMRKTKEYKDEMNARLAPHGAQLAEEPKRSTNPDLIMRQLENIWEKLVAIELIVTGQYPRKNNEARKTEEKHPPVDTNGHPKLANGMTAAWAEVPSADQLLKAAEAFIAKHGKKAFAKLLEEFKAAKLTEVTGDENQAKFMARLQG